MAMAGTGTADRPETALRNGFPGRCGDTTGRPRPGAVHLPLGARLHQIPGHVRLTLPHCRGSASVASHAGFT